MELQWLLVLDCGFCLCDRAQIEMCLWDEWCFVTTVAGLVQSCHEMCRQCHHRGCFRVQDQEIGLMNRQAYRF